MAVIENRATEVGDILVIKGEVPIVGLIVLSSFTDTLLNETQDKLFYKEFRYSVDGINYSLWDELTDLNLSQVQVIPTDTFFIEYRYKRIGSDSGSPDLEFINVEITGEFEPYSYGQAYSNSIFSQFFGYLDLCVLGWMINVLEKLYKKGILPKYIDRGDTSNTNGDDSDFLEFWKTITQFFAYIVCYAREWELSNVTSRTDILSDYLEQYSILLCGSETIDDLQYIMSHYYDEIRHRGTYEMIGLKSEGKPVNGEWHRLFCSLRECSDWYFSLTDRYRVGWVGDNASPLYRGLTYSRQLNKFSEGVEIVDTDDYSLLDNTVVSIVSDTDSRGEMIDILSFTSQSTVTGIGRVVGGSTEGLVKVTSGVSYEVTALVKVDTGVELVFGVSCFDKHGNLVSDGLDSVVSGGSVQSDMFTPGSTMPIDTHYYKVRGIIYSKKVYSMEKTELFDSLRFLDESICYIYPYIGCKSSSGSMKVYSIGVRPLMTSYSTGFEQGGKFIKMMVGNYGKLSNTDAEGKMRSLLLPYNTTYSVDYLTQPEETTLGWCNIIHTWPQTQIHPPLFYSRKVLFYSGGTFQLYEHSSSDGSLSLSPDNIDGETIYVVELSSVFVYSEGSWRFKVK